MIVLDWLNGRDPHPTQHIAAIFGVGLVGSAIGKSIEKRVPARWRHFPYAWSPDDSRPVQTADIVSYIRSVHEDCRMALPLAQHNIDIVWSAGKAGFQASQEMFALEFKPFESVLFVAKDLAEELPGANHAFHLVSSAGGLFEGQKLVGANSEPEPMRPYGLAKLLLEQTLLARSVDLTPHIYRPTSVYGYKRGSRSGLVATLVQNAINNQTSRVFGEISTLRDYAFVGDVGDYIAAQIVERRSVERFSRTHLLASSKPTSVYEIVHLIEAKLHRRLSLRYEPAPSNAEHMSFRPSALPQSWHPTPLEIGIHQTIAAITRDFLMPR